MLDDASYSQEMFYGTSFMLLDNTINKYRPMDSSGTEIRNTDRKDGNAHKVP